MKYIPEDGYGDMPLLELSRRNLYTLLAKLDDPESDRTLISPGYAGEPMIAVRAVEDEEHYSNRAPGLMLTAGVIS